VRIRRRPRSRADSPKFVLKQRDHSKHVHNAVAEQINCHEMFAAYGEVCGRMTEIIGNQVVGIFRDLILRESGCQKPALFLCERETTAARQPLQTPSCGTFFPPNLCSAVSRGWRRTGANPVSARARFDTNNGAISWLQAAHPRCRQRQNRNRAARVASLSVSALPTTHPQKLHPQFRHSQKPL